MKLFVTGATGFVGRSVVDEAVRRGHDVIAVVRPSSESDPAAGCPSVTAARLDLRTRSGLSEAVTGCDAVIHLAAAKAGDFYAQFAGTVVATENLLAAMNEAGVSNLVGISTFSVYDYLSLRPHTVVDEATPIDRMPNRRDEYSRTKLLQEELYRRFGEEPDHRLVILRPGMIYGPDNLWHALLGAEIGPRFVRIGSKATLPLTYVENCAEAIVLAADRLVDPVSGVDGEVINLVDDDLPTQGEYAEAVMARVETPPSITVPWQVVRAAAGLLARGNDLLLDGRARFPGIAVPDRLHARFKPLRYTNAKAKHLLGWAPRYGLDTALDRSVASQSARPMTTNR